MSEARPPFEDEKIYYWGQFVALVVAETLEQARAGAQAVRVEYDAEAPDVRTNLGDGLHRHSAKAVGSAAIPTRLFRLRQSSSTRHIRRRLKPTIPWRCTAPSRCGTATT